MHRSIRWTRTAVVAGLAALALCAPGCGGDDGGESNAASNADTGATTADGNGSAGSAAAVSRNHSGREAEINKVLVGIQDDFVEVDGAGYCDRLAAAGVRQVERFGRTFGHGNDCAKIIDRVAKTTSDAGVEQKPSRLISVKFKGDRAIATIRNGGRPPEPMIFVNEDGAWKVPDPGFTTSLGGSRPLESDPAKRFEQIYRFQREIERRRASRAQSEKGQ